MTNQAILDIIKRSKVISILRRVPRKIALPVVDEMVSAGIEVVEITMDGTDAPEIVREIKSAYGRRVVVGAGTVMNLDQMEIAVQEGADIIFSPHLDETLIRKAVSQSVFMVPGVMTPTEMIQAHRAGADVLKLFPAGVLGPAFIKDVRGPLPDVSLIPTGGIGPHNAAEYLKAGALAVGVGGALVNPDQSLLVDRVVIREKIMHLLRSVHSSE